MKPMIVVVLGMLATVVLVGCGGAPFSVAADELQAGDAGSVVDPPAPDAGAVQQADSGVDSGALEANDAHPASDAGPDAKAAVADAGDAGDAGSLVNEFPGNPWNPPAVCRGPADCLSDTQWDEEGGTPLVLYCGALEGVGSTNDGEAYLLSGVTQCRPTADYADTIVLCLSDFDCSGYTCVTQKCSVATYGSYDGGGNTAQTGVEPILVSYCQGLGTAPAGCD
jgi:hypothetical protein